MKILGDYYNNNPAKINQPVDCLILDNDINNQICSNSSTFSWELPNSGRVFACGILCSKKRTICYIKRLSSFFNLELKLI